MAHFSTTPLQLTPSRFFHAASATARPRVATSACLHGERVRYDGDSRHLPAVDWLAETLDLIPVCPEVGAGLSVPRPPVQLVEAADNAYRRALGRDDPQLDVTQALTDFASASVARLAAMRVCGYLLKSRSPSCGLDSTPLFDERGVQRGITSGIQAAHCRQQLPWLAYCEETDLGDRIEAHAFALRCRLAFDWLHAGEAPSAALHEHYRFLFEQAAGDDSLLARSLEADDRAACLGELQRRCSRVPAAHLLALFTD